MKGFFHLFRLSYGEIFDPGEAGGRVTKNILNLAVTGMLIAISMVIESLTIEVGPVKINFAFLAIAAVGMLMGPTVAFFAGGMCDIVGFLVHPSQAFLPVYVLFAAMQGLIYGLLLYHRWGFEKSGGRKPWLGFAARIVIARLLDVMVINLLCNTAANLHYGFIPQAAFGTAISARVMKNVLELAADLPLLLILMPAVLEIYRRAVGKYSLKSAESK